MPKQTGPHTGRTRPTHEEARGSVSKSSCRKSKNETNASVQDTLKTGAAISIQEKLLASNSGPGCTKSTGSAARPAQARLRSDITVSICTASGASTDASQRLGPNSKKGKSGFEKPCGSKSGPEILRPGANTANSERTNWEVAAEAPGRARACDDRSSPELPTLHGNGDEPMHTRLCNKAKKPGRASPTSRRPDSVLPMPNRSSNASTQLKAFRSIESSTATVSYDRDELPNRPVPNSKNAKPVQVKDRADDKEPEYVTSMTNIKAPKRKGDLNDKKTPKSIPPEAGRIRSKRAVPPDDNTRSTLA